MKLLLEHTSKRIPNSRAYLGQERQYTIAAKIHTMPQYSALKCLCDKKQCLLLAVLTTNLRCKGTARAITTCALGQIWCSTMVCLWHTKKQDNTQKISYWQIVDCLDRTRVTRMNETARKEQSKREEVGVSLNPDPSVGVDMGRDHCVLGYHR